MRAGWMRQTLAESLTMGAGTTRDLAMRTNLPVSATRMTLHNMVCAEQVTKLKPVTVPGVKRPVPVYALASEAPPDEARATQASGGLDWSLITCWAQWPASATIT